MEISGTFPRIVSKQIGIGYIVSLLYFCLNSDLTKCRKHTSREPGKPTADVVDSGILRAFHAPTMHGAPPVFPLQNTLLFWILPVQQPSCQRGRKCFSSDQPVSGVIFEAFRPNDVNALLYVQQLDIQRRLTYGVTPHATTESESRHKLGPVHICTGGAKTNNTVKYAWDPPMLRSSSDIIVHEPRQRWFELDGATLP